jgi:hypothetical protein
MALVPESGLLEYCDDNLQAHNDLSNLACHLELSEGYEPPCRGLISAEVKCQAFQCLSGMEAKVDHRQEPQQVATLHCLVVEIPAEDHESGPGVHFLPGYFHE